MSAFSQILSSVVLLFACACWVEQAVAADAILGEELCDREIGAIVFAGNRVTRAQTLLREIDQKVGKACSIDETVDSIQGIMDLGLFKSVVADMALVDTKVQLRFTVKEKVYFLFIPRLSRTSDGEIRGGAQLRFDNFLGRFHELRITAERREEDDGDGPSGFVNRVNYNIPRFLNSRFGLAFELANDRRQRNLARDGNVFGAAQSKTASVNLIFSRWLSQTSSVRGTRAFFGTQVSMRSFELTDGEAGPFSGGRNVGLIFGVEDSEVHQDTFRRRGKIVGARMTVANSGIGSEFEYTRADFYAEAFVPLKQGIRNLNMQFRAGISDGAPFGEHTYQLGGGERLRGLRSDDATGNALVLLNVEYLHAWFNYPQWRWVAFTDIGNVYRRDAKDVPFLQLSGGFGLRRKILSLSNTDIRIDVAWDPKRERLQTYVASSVTF